MLITKSYHDVPSKLNDGRPIRIFVISPVVPNYPKAKFPGMSSMMDPYRSNENKDRRCVLQVYATDVKDLT